jgi:hypothetical protein
MTDLNMVVRLAIRPAQCEWSIAKGSEPCFDGLHICRTSFETESSDVQRFSDIFHVGMVGVI